VHIIYSVKRLRVAVARDVVFLLLDLAVVLTLSQSLINIHVVPLLAVPFAVLFVVVLLTAVTVAMLIAIAAIQIADGGPACVTARMHVSVSVCISLSTTLDVRVRVVHRCKLLPHLVLSMLLLLLLLLRKLVGASSSTCEGALLRKSCSKQTQVLSLGDVVAEHCQGSHSISINAVALALSVLLLPLQRRT